MPSLSAIRARIAASPTLTAVALMVMASALLASMHGMVRYMSFGLPAFEIAFFRNMFGFAVLIPFIAHHGSRLMHVPRFGLHALRGGLNGASMLIWFSALSLVPPADPVHAVASVGLVGSEMSMMSTPPVPSKWPKYA